MRCSGDRQLGSSRDSQSEEVFFGTGKSTLHLDALPLFSISSEVRKALLYVTRCRDLSCTSQARFPLVRRLPSGLRPARVIKKYRVSVKSFESLDSPSRSIESRQRNGCGNDCSCRNLHSGCNPLFDHRDQHLTNIPGALFIKPESARATENCLP